MDYDQNQEMNETPISENVENTGNAYSQPNQIPSGYYQPQNGGYQQAYQGYPYQEPNYAYSYRPDDASLNKSAVKKKHKKERKGIPTAVFIAVALCCAVIGAVCSGFFFQKRAEAPSESASSVEEKAPAASAEEKSDSETAIYNGNRPVSDVHTVEVDTGKAMSVSEVYAQNVASTVGIQTQITTNYFGYTTNSAASGSGFILTEDGYVITNYHVIEDANSVTVMTYDGKSYDADIIGYDETNDTAVLKIEAEALVPVVLGSSDALSVGDQVIAIGNPLGELTFSLTSGYVSALNREITMSNNLTMKLIQTDCAINSGNSGGALFNLYGEVIGITNAKLSSSGSSASIDNIGFAIPIDDVRGNIISIIENGYFKKPYIGVMISTVSSDMINYGLPAGAIIKEITEGGPADEAGLVINDIISKANGEEILTSADLVSYVNRCGVGDSLELEVYRDGKTITVKLVVGEKEESALPSEDEAKNNESQNPQQEEQQQQQPYYFFNWPFDFFGYGNGNQQNSQQGNNYW